ncbi:NACHT and WD repeat domain-containing protein 2 isoform X2 [Gouania willdenowi]|uniref:NACHT and WD repeat domain-containing protein 2 isoform X2 n=1 Tax=Gouania willdenowi TaxID=441366 RepID=UPI0010553115|nr:NACHT and WD repeat domain-containing protein 2-like isoform X2 [Gouania willdenowi]
MCSRGGIPISSSSCVKIYLCSNPEDSVVERRALRETVFPRFREHCRHSLGLDVRVIDPFESTDSSCWPDENTRQQLIRECRERSAGLFFLQEQVEEAKRSQINVEKVELMKRFQRAVTVCVQRGLMSPHRAKAFYRSVLDVDLRFALNDTPEERLAGRCLVYIHKVVNAKGERQKLLRKSNIQFKAGPSDQASLISDLTDGDLLAELCDTFLPNLITDRHLLVYTTTTECDSRHGYTTNNRRGYAEALSQQVNNDLLELTDGDRSSIPEPRGDAWSREQEEQEELSHVLSSLYEVILPEEEQVRTYMEQRDLHLPLLITGGPCTGKTVLLAHCSQQIKTWLSDFDPVVISYFCNLSTKASAKHLLSSLCCQILERYQGNSINQDQHFFTDSRSSNWSLRQTEHSLSSNPDIIHETKPRFKGLDVSLTELKDYLSSILTSLPSTKQPLVLLLDGLDQIDNFGLQIMENLHTPLPPNVKVIYTASPNRARFLQAFVLHYPQQHGCSGYSHVQLRVVKRKQCVKMLVTLLKDSGRKVTSGQLTLVNQALDHCCLPLYARLLHAHTLLWQSDSDVTESSLPLSIHSSISALLTHLEHKHGCSVVAHAVSYLTLSCVGLTEAELADLLFVYSDRTPDDCDCGNLSDNVKTLQVDVERLFLDFKGFLITRTVGGAQVLLWVNRHVGLVVLKKYLDRHELREKIHKEMADYFKSWLGHESLNTKEHAMKKFSSLPQVSSRLCNAGHYVRQVTELTYHLKQSGRLDDLDSGLVFSPSFHQVMVQAGLLGDLVAMLESEVSSESEYFKERLLLAGTLKSAECFLRSFPLELFTVMESRLLPFVRVFPALQSYIKDSRKKRGNSIGVLLCPCLSCVPPIQRLKCGNKTSIREAVSTEFGVVVEVLNDGSVWIWKGYESELAKLSLSCEQHELVLKGVKSSGQFFLLSTQCNKLFVCDLTGPQTIVEIKNYLKDDDEAKQSSKRVDGFVSCRQKLFMSWENESCVSVFDISGEILMYFYCQSPVTCLAVSSDGFFLYCAMEESTVAIFDINTTALLGTCSNPNFSAIGSMFLCEDMEMMATVDRNGNVGLWDLTDKTQPLRIVKELFSEVESNSLLSAEYCDENNSLLVCQRNCVTWWDTCNWELWDKFLAPQGRAFTQAVASHNRQLLLASLETVSLVLVWRLSTGECVFSLEMSDQPFALLKSSTNIICVAHDGSLAVWDAEMIHAAGSSFRMQGGVKDVLVDEEGKWFYTADRSESVWRWCLDTGLPHAYFLHDGPVEKVKLSPNCLQLVSISAGDIYLWRTETGENVMRISGSRANDILITSNSNIGVSISDHGLSRVWKMAQGNIVCSIHLYLTDAQVSPEGTFLIGRRHGDLLAASLWSGSISKRFSCAESSEHITAFHLLSHHPDFVLVMAASGAVYTWNVAEETVCRHFHLPHTFYCQPQHFHMCNDGSYALLSTEDNTINLLDLSQMRLCSFKTDGPVLKACLDKNGDFIAYICCHASLENHCSCYQQSRSVLTATRLSDGERIGRVHLFKIPQTLMVCKQQRVFVGFDDGSLGVYSVSNVMSDEDDMINEREKVKSSIDREPFKWFPLPFANITWH